MKIGVDLCNLDPEYTGGLNSFALSLVAGLIAILPPDDKLVLFVTGANRDFLRREFSGAGVEFLILPLGTFEMRMDSAVLLVSWIARNFMLRYWYDRIFRARIMREIDKAVDVFLAPMTVLRCFATQAPALLSMHDIQQEYHPEFFTWRERVSRWAPYRLSARRAAAIQASSRYIKNCLVEKFPSTDPQKITVIAEGVDREKFSLDTPAEMPPELNDLRGGAFVFYPAQIWPHKNHLLLMDALALFRDRTGIEMPCILTGGAYGHWPVVQERIAVHGLKQVRYLGRVSFPRLLWLYRNCVAVLALGMHESSSLPLREGAVFGKVLIALDIPPNREARDRLVVTLVNGTDPNDLAGAFVSLSDAGTIGTAQENGERVHCFDWKAIAGEYYPILKQLAEARAQCRS